MLLLALQLLRTLPAADGLSHAHAHALAQEQRNGYTHKSYPQNTHVGGHGPNPDEPHVLKGVMKKAHLNTLLLNSSKQHSSVDSTGRWIGAP